MDNAHNGAVLVSFGSTAKSSDMSKDFKNAFVSAFESFPEVSIYKDKTQKSDFSSFSLQARMISHHPAFCYRNCETMVLNLFFTYYSRHSSVCITISNIHLLLSCKKYVLRCYCHS